ncbi:MAG: acyl-CoA thioesterase [Bacteroidaceae bacterium]|nr:acyl-CoA thioesterase [Bacteroidaceae bacterium]
MTEEQKIEEVFHHRQPIQIRFNDVDGYGHVNNNAYFAFYDLGKESYLAEVLKKDFRTGDVVPVVANINANFLFPIFYGDSIVVETRVSHLGQKSFTLCQRAINEKTGMVVCECSTVMVCFSLKNQNSAEIPADFRAAIEAFETGKG